jgi:hypothetical protein
MVSSWCTPWTNPVGIRNLGESLVYLLCDREWQVCNYNPCRIIQHDEGMMIAYTGTRNEAKFIAENA